MFKPIRLALMLLSVLFAVPTFQGVGHAKNAPVVEPLSENVAVNLPQQKITLLPSDSGGSATKPSRHSRQVQQGISALNREVRNRTWYTWGGGHGRRPGKTRGSDGRVGFDCSGLSRWFVDNAIGRDLLGSGTASSQLAKARSLGAKVIRARDWYNNRKPGDLLFYGHSRIHHVAIYVGDGYIIEAPHSNARVRKVPFYQGDFFVAMRLPFR
jgi:peptidoglycan DL-endopeptidase RipA